MTTASQRLIRTCRSDLMGLALFARRYSLHRVQALSNSSRLGDGSGRSYLTYFS